MERESFLEFTAATLRSVVFFAEDWAKKEGVQVKFAKPPAFRWMGKEIVTEDIAERIVEKVWEGPEKIQPCVDIGVYEVLSGGTPVIVGRIAGYPPGPFGINWTGRVGPFVYVVGGAFVDKVRARKA